MFSIEKLSKLRDSLYKVETETVDESTPLIYIGKATCCLAAGAEDIHNVLIETLNEQNINARIITVGCLGHCYGEPFLIIKNPGFPSLFYCNLTSGITKIIVKGIFVRGEIIYENLLGSMEDNDLIPPVTSFPRFSMEKRMMMEQCGRIDPDNINRYIINDGYGTVANALAKEPEKIIEEIKMSGLRGRGGAGFHVWKKWAMVKESEKMNKIVICNADEGDPGAYMDRTIIESNPHQLLEGIILSSYAVGACEAYVYLRSEYPLAVKKIEKAIIDAESLNLLGENILGSGFNLKIELFKGSGAFVCGEETALISSIEGKRGMPYKRPPFPAEKGLWGRPTLINNVKTFYAIPHIVKNGGDWYSKIGSPNSPGTAIFSVVGNIVHAGLVEIPTGITIRSLIFDICGGIPNGKKFKAVQIGGPSGGCLPESCLDIPVDFDSLIDAGAMMGSGGIVVMDEDSCMVDVARYFLEFTEDESCGKCTFCRLGTKHLLDILTRITKGEGVEGDIELLENLSMDIKEGSLCSLGKTAPNPVLTTIKYFRHEYEAHINEKRCPALKCRSLTAIYIDLDLCARGCDACVGSCPVDCIFTTKGRKKGIDQVECVKCAECITACPAEYDAVKKISPVELVPIIEKPDKPAHK